MKHGHIKISRKMFDGHDELWSEPREFSKAEAWLDLLQVAAYLPRDFSTAQHGTDKLARGEFVASLRFLAVRWKWSKNRVAGFLRLLVKLNRLAGQRAGQHGTIYRIENYDTYQSNNSTARTRNGTAKGTATGQPRDKEESSTSNTSRIYTPEFERAFAAYPKRLGGNSKREAFGKWTASLNRGADPKAMEDGVHRYAKFCDAIHKTGTEFVKQAATFFGPSECWLDAWDVPLHSSRGGLPRIAETLALLAVEYELVAKSDPDSYRARMQRALADPRVTDRPAMEAAIKASQPWTLGTTKREWLAKAIADRLGTVAA